MTVAVVLLEKMTVPVVFIGTTTEVVGTTVVEAALVMVWTTEVVVEAARTVLVAESTASVEDATPGRAMERVTPWAPQIPWAISRAPVKFVSD